MHPAIHQMDFFKPMRDANNPPRIPPRVRNMTPMVPYTIPTSAVDSSRPPDSLEATRKGIHILMRNASGRRYSNMNTMASNAPGLVK